MKFSQIEIGALFIWRGEVCIKLSEHDAKAMHTKWTVRLDADEEVDA